MEGKGGEVEGKGGRWRGRGAVEGKGGWREKYL